MKRILLVLIVCCMAGICVLNNRPPVVRYSRYHTVVAGDTLDGIAGKYYQLDGRNICWDEYRTEIWEINRHLQNGSRMLQPGDNVKIVWYERKSK